MNDKIDLTITFGDGRVEQRNVHNYPAQDSEFINWITRSFDIPEESLSESDKDQLINGLNEISGGSDKVTISLECIKEEKHKKFDDIFELFSNYLNNTEMRSFWINYATWNDFREKIETIFIDSQFDQNAEKLILWDNQQTLIYTLDEENTKPTKKEWDPVKLLNKIDTSQNSIFILEDFDMNLEAFDNYYGREVKPALKNILDSDILNKNNNYIIVAANASDEIEIPSQLRGFWVTYQDSSKDYPVLESLGENLTAKAIANQYDEIIGRDSEIDELINILSKNRYNNILLVGRPGVGKTSIIEGLAQRIANNEVPDNLTNVKIFDIPFADIVRDTQVAGSLENKIKNLQEEVKSHRNEVIVFFDEFHQIMSNDTIRNTLKPPLANGEFPAIGATTNSEYTRFVSGTDEAFLQRFNRINIDELPQDSVIEIFNKIIDNCEKNISVQNDELNYLYWLCKRLNPLQALPRSGVKVLSNILSNIKDDERLTKHIIKNNFSVGKISDRLAKEFEWKAILNNISEKILGQEEQIENVLDQIRQHYFILSNINRPLVMMFMGPTGTGKTQLARELTKQLWNDENRALLFNMGSVTHKSSITGAPPGYVGYENSSPILNFIGSNDSGIIILDEFEKVGNNSEIQDSFLEIFDKGTTSDNQGKKINCRPFIFVLTSNLGQELSPSSSEEDVSNLLTSEGLKPEFVGRIDLIKVFNRIDKQAGREIVKNYLRDYNNLPEYNCTFSFANDETIDFILTKADYKKFGARKIKRTFDKVMNTILLDNMDKLEQPNSFEIYYKSGQFTLRQNDI